MKNYLIKFKAANEPDTPEGFEFEHIEGAIEAIDPEAIYYAPDTCVVKTTASEADLKTQIGKVLQHGDKLEVREVGADEIQRLSK